MAGEQADRPPLFEDGIRSEVLDGWRQEGLPAEAALSELFTFDRREELAEVQKAALKTGLEKLGRYEEALGDLMENLARRK